MGLLTVFVSPSIVHAALSCPKVYGNRQALLRAQDHAEDFRFFGNFVSVSDGMGTTQRLHPHRSFWAVADAHFRPSVELTEQLRVDTSQAKESNTVELHLNMENPEKLLILEMGGKPGFSRDPKFFNMSLRRSLDLRASDGLSIRISSEELLEMKIVVASHGLQDRNGFKLFEKPVLFQSDFQKIPKFQSGQSTQFYWDTFTDLSGTMPLTSQHSLNHVWIVFRNPGKLKTVNLKFEGPIYVEQDIFGESAHGHPEKYWEGMGRSQPAYLKEPISESFKAKIRKNLYNPEFQMAALSAMKNGTLETSLKGMGFQYHLFEEKFNANGFFNFFNFISHAQIPIEMGEFGKYHGAEAHAAQVFAITRGMTPEEIDLFRNLYREIGKNAEFGWKIWTALFDNHDPEKPTSPRYWKNLERENFSENRE